MLTMHQQLVIHSFIHLSSWKREDALPSYKEIKENLNNLSLNSLIRDIDING